MTLAVLAAAQLHRLHEYLDAGIVTTAVGMLIAGVTLYAGAALTSEGSTWRIPGEPVLSLAVLLMYGPLAYFFGAGSAFVSGADVPVAFGLAFFLGCALLHGFYKIQVVVTTRRQATLSALDPDNHGRLNGQNQTETPELLSRVQVSSSPRTYREQIIPAESGASRIDRLPKRISVIFKDEGTVKEIAEQRFGPGSPSVEHYLAEHRDRRAHFFGSLQRGMICREIYSQDELIKYVASRRHSAFVELSPPLMRQTVVRWREALQLQPNYLVGLTRDPLPFKYEIIDGQMVVMHEAIGVSDLHRLNALFIQSEIVGGEFENDFEVIWDRIPTPLRSKQGVVDWIDANLVPLLDAKGGRPMKSRARATGDI